MSKSMLVVGIILLAVCSAERPRPQRIRFEGPVQNNHGPKFAERQVAAPYPPAGQRPEPPFELPTEEAASFPAPKPTYLPPEQTYGPPDQTYGPPDQTYGPPDQTYGPPEQTYGPPDQTYGPPEQTNDYPKIEEDNNALPQTASIIDRDLFFPQTLLTLPRVQRLIAFRPARRPAPLRRRPNNVRRPAKVQQRPIRRPQPAKLIVSVGGGPEQGFAQLPPHPRRPIFAGERLIAYSDRKQSW